MENPEEPSTHEELPWWKQNISLLLLTGMFALMAMLVPVDIIDRVKALFKVEPVNISAPFQEETARLDAALESGTPLTLERDALRQRRHDIMLRRILRAGPLNGEEVRRIKLLLAEIDAQAQRETSSQAVEAWRTLRLKKLTQAHPRLDAKALERELKLFETQYQEATRGGGGED